MGYVKLVELADCKTGGGTFIEHADLKLAVFLLAGPDRAFVIDDECPHAGGSLSSGEVSRDKVVCPWHHWEFDLASGESTHSRLARVRSYPARIRDGFVWADLDAEAGCGCDASPGSA